MNVLVIGFGGAIGDAIVTRLLRDEHAVTAVSRGGPTGAAGALRRRRADRAAPGRILEIIAEDAIDAVVDVVAYTRDESAALADALDGRIERYVMLSSMDVYRNFGRVHRRETGAPDEGLLDEDAPLRANLHLYRGATPRAPDDPSRWLDDYDKIPIERIVADMAGDWTILRLPMVYGPSDRKRRFRWAIAPILAGASRLEVPTAWAAWTSTYAYIDNVAAAVALSVEHPAASRKVFNVTDAAPVDHRAWIARFAGAIGWTGEVAARGDGDDPISVAARDLDLTIPLVVSGARLKERLGFVPPIGLDDAVARTIEAEAQLG